MSSLGAADEAVPAVRAIVFPRDANPYQELLYSRCAAHGMEVTYAGELTGSRTLNLALLPLELLVRRLRGWNVLHLHWTYAFGLAGSARFPFLHWVASAWFVIVLATARACGLRIAWTAHNVLQHQRVFHDDVAMGRLLVRAADVVIVHSTAAERELTALLGHPAALAVIPHPPFALEFADGDARPTGPLRLLFFGRLAAYKGVEDLLSAMSEAGSALDLRLTVAGACDDRDLARRLGELSAPLGEQVEMRLAHVPEERLSGLLREHDLLVLPFRRTTTSGSALLGLGAGIAVAVPDLPAFEEMPVLRFEPGKDGLMRFLQSLAGMDRADLQEFGDAGREWATAQMSWEGAAEATKAALADAVSRPRRRS
jgi:glycosyltransferase involved in cell wall biosynthesis